MSRTPLYAFALVIAGFLTLGCAGGAPWGDLAGGTEPAADAAPPAAPVELPPVLEGTENRDACRAYIHAFNGLSCLPADARLDETVVCLPELDIRGCDQTRYWACMPKMMRCDGMLPVPGDSASCSPVCG